MKVFLITTSAVLFIALLLNFGSYFFKRIFPFFIGKKMLWDKQNDRLKLLIGITTIYFAYFAFRSLWTVENIFEGLNVILYAILLVSNILFYIIYIQNRLLFNILSLGENSEENKKIERKHFDEKVKECKHKIQSTLDFFELQKYKADLEKKLIDKMSNKTDCQDSFFLDFEESKLQKMYKSFRNEGIIDKSLTIDDFKRELKHKSLRINLSGPSLYYFHKMLKGHINISLFDFVSYFKKKNNEPFNYNTVRNGSQQSYPLYKELFEEMFIE